MTLDEYLKTGGSTFGLPTPAALSDALERLAKKQTTAARVVVKSGQRPDSSPQMGSRKSGGHHPTSGRGGRRKIRVR